MEYNKKLAKLTAAKTIVENAEQFDAWVVKEAGQVLVSIMRTR